MSQNEKLSKRLKSKPKDFTYDELRKLLASFGYEEDKSKEGSRVEFVHPATKNTIQLHKPHPGNILKMYQLKIVLTHLEEHGLI